MTPEQLEALRAAAEDEARYPVTAGWAATAETAAGPRTRPGSPTLRAVVHAAIAAGIGIALCLVFPVGEWVRVSAVVFAATLAASVTGDWLLGRLPSPGRATPSSDGY